jgi:tRNA threonylcarbamoyladenosine biosynthesis protein TsaB
MIGESSQQVILALDSAGLACSVAVGLGERVLALERVDTMHGQAEALLPLADRAMREAGLVPAALDFVAATVGPGSFTGIRVGLAAAHGIAIATRARLIGATSFEAVAVAAARRSCAEVGVLLIALESRREDLYVQTFNLQGHALCEPAAIMPSALADAVHGTIGKLPLLIAGDAAERAAAALALRPNTMVLGNSEPDAIGALRAGLRLVRLGKPGTTQPLYLRPPNVTPANGLRKRKLARP